MGCGAGAEDAASGNRRCTHRPVSARGAFAERAGRGTCDLCALAGRLQLRERSDQAIALPAATLACSGYGSAGRRGVGDVQQ